MDFEFCIFDLFLLARNVDNGRKAVEELSKQGLVARFHQLDIENTESIQKFSAYLKETHGGIDILVNNAAINIRVFTFFLLHKYLPV